MNRRILAITILALLATATVSQVAVANFNAATGFSGRHGFTCTSCHQGVQQVPVDESEYVPEATVTLTGLPDAWNLGQEYELTVTVTGGPEALPAPAPQGGFEIEAAAGVFRVPDGMEDFINVYADDEQAVTYTVAGTQMREWRVTWIAPALPSYGADTPAWWAGLDQLAAAPADVTFWVAAMAANGNHVVAAGQGDFGELGDAVDNITVAVPPSPAAIEGWEAIRLITPEADDLENDTLVVKPFAPFTIEGHQDFEATHVAYSLDGGPWERRSAPDEWSIPFGNGLTPGEHTLLVRSENDLGHISDPLVITIQVEESAAEGVETPFPALVSVAALLIAVAWRRMQ